jgi:predicted outer membrane repeat protein
MSLTDSTFQYNSQPTQSNGIIYLDEGNFTSIGSRYSHNVIDTGGVISLYSAYTTIYNDSFIDNNAVGDLSQGSAIYLACAYPCISSTAQIDDTSFIKNIASNGDGGAIYCDSFAGEVLLRNNYYQSNSAVNGGAIAVYMTKVTIRNSSFTSNTAQQGGGGVYWTYSSSMFTEIDEGSCTVLDNQASYGSFVATNVVQLNVSQDQSISEVSGSTLASSILVYLEDYYHQPVTNSSLTSASLTIYCAVYNDTGIIRGSTIVSAILGVATFSQLILVGEPGSSVTLQFSIPITEVPDVTLSVPLRSCISGEITVPQGSSQSTDFATCQRCSTGSYSFFPTDTVCQQCPYKTKCPGGNVLDLAANYWRVDDISATVLACPTPYACLGGPNITSQCRVGQEGPYCTVCSTGYTRSQDGLCYSCENSNSLGAATVSTVLFVIFFIGILLVVRYYKKIIKWYSKLLNQTVKNRKFKTLRVKLKILVAFAQIVYQLGPAFNIIFPVSFVEYLNYYSIFQLNLVFLPDVGCIVQTNYYNNLLISTISPFILYGVIVIGLGIMVWHAKRLNERNPYYTEKYYRRDVVTSAFIISYFVLVSVSTKIFQVYQCETFDNDQSYLVADYSINCNSNNRSFYILYGSLMILIYPIGIPFAYAIMLVRNRHKINPDWRKVIDEKEKSFVSKNIIQKGKIKVRRTYPEITNISFLYDSYVPRRWYFELVESARRLMLGAIPVLILRGSSLQIIVVMLVSLAGVAIFMFTKPYIHKHDNQLAILAQWSITFVIIGALIIKVQALEGNNNTSLGIVLIIINVCVITFSIISSILNSSVQEDEEEEENEDGDNNDGSGKHGQKRRKRKGGENSDSTDLNNHEEDDDEDEDSDSDDEDDEKNDLDSMTDAQSQRAESKSHSQHGDHLEDDQSAISGTSYNSSNNQTAKEKILNLLAIEKQKQQQTNKSNTTNETAKKPVGQTTTASSTAATQHNPILQHLFQYASSSANETSTSQNQRNTNNTQAEESVINSLEMKDLSAYSTAEKTLPKEIVIEPPITININKNESKVRRNDVDLDSDDEEI